MKDLTLKFGDKEVKFTFGLYFIGMVQFNYDCDMSELFEKLTKAPFKVVPDLMFWSAEYMAELDGVPFLISKGDFTRMILSEEGNVNSKNCEAFLNGLSKSIQEHFPSETEAVLEGDEGKKK